MIALTLTVILECWRTLVGRIWLNEEGTSVLHSFYLHGAMLARILAMALCLSLSVCICLLQVGVLSRRMNESSWVLAWELFSTYPACILRKFGYLQSKVLSFRALSQTPDLENFATAYRSSKRVINFARQRWTLRT